MTLPHARARLLPAVRLAFAATAFAATAFAATAFAVTALARPVAAQAAAPAPTVRVQAGVSVQPDTVTIGTPFVVSVRVRAPLGADVTFPEGPDTTGVVQPLDPIVVGESTDTAAVDRTARYRLAAWDLGTQTVQLGSVRIATPAGVRELRLDAVRVEVASVLPADTAEWVPRPARGLFEFAGPWWIPWLLGLLALALLALLIWWLLRRRRRAKPVRIVDPFQAAEERFAGIESLGLLEAGERGRYVALMMDVTREYLGRRFPAARSSLTSRELLGALSRERAVPTDRLAVLLHEGDLIKFARRPVTVERARELGTESRAIVHAVHTAPPPEAAVPPVRRPAVGSAA